MGKPKKTGPKPKPLAEKQRNAVMVRFADREFAALKSKAQRQPLSSFLRERGLA